MSVNASACVRLYTYMVNSYMKRAKPLLYRRFCACVHEQCEYVCFRRFTFHRRFDFNINRIYFDKFHLICRLNDGCALISVAFWFRMLRTVAEVFQILFQSMFFDEKEPIDEPSSWINCYYYNTQLMVQSTFQSHQPTFERVYGSPAVSAADKTTFIIIQNILVFKLKIFSSGIFSK